MSKKVTQQLSIWLMTVMTLIVVIVAIGGITRLTDSGLSMVDWQPILGVLPPLTTSQWVDAFELYQQFPQYEQTHSHISLSQFKFIFFWEYIHRILGRIIGLVILLPFIYFLFKRILTPTQKKMGWAMLVLVIVQGLAGWYMVMSGLVDIGRVSHFRLAVHLSLAFTLFLVTFWFYLSLRIQRQRELKSIGLGVFFCLLVMQIIYGAFTAGLDAGFTYNSFPKMGMYWFPPELNMYSSILENVLYNPVRVQFIHRYMGLGLFFFSFILVVRERRFLPLLLFTFGQFLLGVMTIVMHIPISVAVLHQIGALALLSVTVYLWYRYLA